MPLNNHETLPAAAAGPYRKIMMIPLRYANSTVLAVPEPDKQSADVYLIEMPITQVIELDATGVHVRPPMYLSDPYSTKNFTAIVPPNVFE